MRLIESVAHLPRGASPPAASARASAAGAVVGVAGAATIILAAPQNAGELPFLAQYVAQEILGSDQPASRWRDRDTAYRLAGARVAPAQITIDI